MSKRKTTDQIIAEVAWRETPQEVTSDLKSLVNSAPALIQSCGFGQAIAFYMAKGKDHHKTLVNAIAKWVLRNMDQYKPKDPDNLMKAILEGDSKTYRLFTNEAMSFLSWYKRFVIARAK